LLLLLVGVSTLSAAAGNEKVGDRLMRSQDDGQLRLIVNHAGASLHSSPEAKPVDELQKAEAEVGRAQAARQKKAEKQLDAVSHELQKKGHHRSGTHTVPYNLKIANPNYHAPARNTRPENKNAPKPKIEPVQQLASSPTKVMLASTPSLLQDQPFIPAPLLEALGDPLPELPAKPAAQPAQPAGQQAWPVGEQADLTKAQVPADVGETVTLAPPLVNQLAHASVDDLSAGGSPVQVPPIAAAASVASWPIEGTQSAEKPLQAVPAAPAKLEAPPTKLETTFSQVPSPALANQGVRYSDGSVDVDHGISASPSPHPSPTPLAQ